MNDSERPNRGGAEGPSAALRDLPESDRSLLIVDDDAPLCQRLARAMERRGFIVSTADSVAGGVAAATGQVPAFAVVDMRLGDGRGFEIVGALRQARPSARIVMLTGYGNIATARRSGARASIGTISLSHTAANGSGRRRPRGTFFCERSRGSRSKR